MLRNMLSLRVCGNVTLGTLLMTLTVGRSLSYREKSRQAKQLSPKVNRDLLFWRKDKFQSMYTLMPAPVVSRSKVCVWGCSLAWIAGLKPTGGTDVRLLWVFVLPRRCLCDRLITHPEESYWVWRVIMKPRWGSPGPLEAVQQWAEKIHAHIHQQFKIDQAFYYASIATNFFKPAF